MSSQRHFVYLLPRADPEELQDDELPPCTCSHRDSSSSAAPVQPLQLRIRIPPRASSSTTSSNQASTSASTSKTPTSSSSSSASLRHRRRGTTPTTPSDPSSTSSIPSSSSHNGSSSPGTATHGKTSNSSSTSTSTSHTLHTDSGRNSRNISHAPPPPIYNRSSPTSSATVRGPKHQFTSWKLIAPQVKTLSATSNIYLLSEAFANTLSSSSLLSSSTSSTLSPSSSHSPDKTDALNKSGSLNTGNDLVSKMHILMADGQPTSTLHHHHHNGGKIPLPSPYPTDTLDPFMPFSSPSNSKLNTPSSHYANHNSNAPATFSLSTIQEVASEDGRSERSSSAGGASGALASGGPGGPPSLSATTHNGSGSSTATITTASQARSISSSSATTSQREDHDEEGTSTAKRPPLTSGGVSSASGSGSGSGSGSTSTDTSASESASGSGSGSGRTCSTPISATSLATIHEITTIPCPLHSMNKAEYSASASTEAATMQQLPTTSASSPIQRTTSSSTISSIGTTLSRTASTASRRKIPSAYRKEMESVLFAQTAVSSAPSSSPPSSTRKASGGPGGNAISNPIPSLTSTIFSMSSNDDSIWSTNTSTSNDRRHSSARSSSTTTSPTSSLGHSSISSIPFLVDAPNLIDTRRRNPKDATDGNLYKDDPFYLSTSNCNVIPVNDLSWYLEKVLWKLGMHRKGRKEFMSYWLPRFANDDYVALRFLTQDVIASFAPIDITVVPTSSTVEAPSLPTPASISSNTLSSNAHIRPSLSISTLNTRPQLVNRRESNYSISSAQSENELHEGYNTTSSSLSVRSASNTSFTSSLDTSLTQDDTPHNSNAPPPKNEEESRYSLHRIHCVFQRLKADEIRFFQYRVKYRSGSSTEGVIDWSELPGVKPTEESKREDTPRLLHVSATDLGLRGHYYH